MAELTPLYEKKCTCLMCKSTFTTQKIRSRFIKVSNYDTDFFPTYESEEINPILYHVNVCPKCGFSFADEFAPYFPPGSKEILMSKVSNNWVSHDYGGVRTIKEAIKTYKLAAYCATLKREKHVSIAGLCMRLAWLYRMLGNKEQEKHFLNFAGKEYMESYMADDFQGTQISEVRLLYLIGEISRRIDNHEQAVKYFSKVIEKQSQTVETKIVEMARERWYEMREQQKELSEIAAAE